MDRSHGKAGITRLPRAGASVDIRRISMSDAKPKQLKAKSQSEDPQFFAGIRIARDIYMSKLLRLQEEVRNLTPRV